MLPGSRKTQTELFTFGFGFFFFLVWAQGTHTEEGDQIRTGMLVGTSVGPEVYTDQWSRSQMTWIEQCIVTFTASFFSFIDFFFLSFSRYHNMGNLLKVLTCTDLEQEPNFFLDFESEFLFMSNCFVPNRSHEYLNVAISHCSTPTHSHTHISFFPAAEEAKVELQPA